MFIGCSPSEIFMKQANCSNFSFDEAHGHAMSYSYSGFVTQSMNYPEELGFWGFLSLSSSSH